MAQPRILIAGIGNVFFGDDAFGVEVVQRLHAASFPQGVDVRDFGIRGIDLALAIEDGYDAVILVDAIQRGGKPGELHVLEPALDFQQTIAEPHGLDVFTILRQLQPSPDKLPRMIVVGCEPGSLDFADSGDLGLSEPVRAAVAETETIVAALVARLLEDPRGDLNA